MTIKLQKPDITELKPRITVFGVGGGGGNAVNNMISAGLQGVDFVVANTDAQALTMTKAERIIQLGANVTEGLGAGSQPEVGRAAAEECIDEIIDHLNGTHMCFVTAGMGGGTGTGAAPVVAQAARNKGILTVGVVTKPFHFEGGRRMRLAESGIEELQKSVDTLIVIPNQNLFRIANDKTTFADAFAMADQVLYSGVACITDLMVKEGLINLDFADVRSVMREMGRAMMGTGEASGQGRAMQAAEAAIANPLLDETSMKGAQGLPDLHHRRPRPDALRSRRGCDPHSRRSRSGCQHHPRRDLRRIARRHHPRFCRCDRYRPCDERSCCQELPACRQADYPSFRGRCSGTGRSSACASHAGTRSRPIRSRRPSAWRKPRWNASSKSRLRGLQLRFSSLLLRTRSVRRAASSQPLQEAPAARPAPVQPAPAPVMSQPAPQPVDPADAAARFARNLPCSGEPVRMPKVEDFPPVVQAEIDHRAQPAAAQAHEERGPMGLLKRITNSLGRREEEVAPEMTAAPAAASQQRRPLSPEASLYAPRRGNLDDQGRSVPQARMMQEDDQLEIPAFLRRQSN